MKKKSKKMLASGIAVTVAGVFGVEALLQTSVSVQASAAMMPGIEQIVEETSEKEPFRILEIVDEEKDAEIGYYVSGQEPFLKLYRYTYEVTDDKGNPVVDDEGTPQTRTIRFSSVDEALSILPSERLRKEFIMNVKLGADGKVDPAQSTNIRQIQDVLWKQDSDTENNQENYPLSYSEYQEKYFLSQEEKDSEQWKQIDFQTPEGEKRIAKTELHGEYVPNQQQSGNYTKQPPTYFPVRINMDESNGCQKFRENIQSFYYLEGEGNTGPYYLEFQPVDNATVNASLEFTEDEQSKNLVLKEYEDGRYGYFENVYVELTEDRAEKIQEGTFAVPGEDPPMDKGDNGEPTDGKKVAYFENLSLVETFTEGDEALFSGVSEDNETLEQQGETVLESPGEDVLQTPVQEETVVISNGEFSTGSAESAFDSSGDVFGSSAEDMSGTQMQSEWEAVPDDGDVPLQDGHVTEETAQNTENSGDIGAPENENDIGQPSADENGENNDLAVLQEETGQPAADEPQKPLFDFEDKTTAGTSSNPYVYLTENIDEYPYYKYTLVSDLKKVLAEAVKSKEKDKAHKDISTTPLRKGGDITQEEDGAYYYWNNETTKSVLSVVEGRMPVAYKDVKPLSDQIKYNYYFRVSDVYFCCRDTNGSSEEGRKPEDYQYFGWYSPVYRAGEERYLPVDADYTEQSGVLKNVATYYMLDSEFKLTPEIGDYDFYPDEDKELCKVEVDHLYYQGGYVNHDWLKRYVFHLSPDDPDEEVKEQFHSFQIQVDTMRPDEADKLRAAGQPDAARAVDNSEGATAGFTDSEGLAAGFSDTAALQAENTDVQETADFSDSSENGAVQDADTSSDVFPDANTSEVSVPVSYSQEIIGLETAGQEIAAEPTENTAEAAEFTSGETDTTDEVDDFEDGLQTELTTGSTDTGFSSGEAAPAARAAEASENETEKQLALADYDLVYVNGTISVETAQEIISLDVPCIVNQGSQEAEAFADFRKDDVDGHYVNGIVYFFKNMETFTDKAGDMRSSLLNLKFHTAFSTDEEKLGFEEITEYINNENKYREVEQSELGDGEKVLLDLDISQARAIEYILNYRYKRNVSNKDTINVLEIQPAKNGNRVGELKEKDIFKWAGVVVDNGNIEKNEEEFPGHDNTRATCSTAQGNFKFENMFDGDGTTVWETALGHTTIDTSAPKYNRCHFIKLRLKDVSDIKGIIYTPRQNGQRGVFKDFDVALYDRDKKELDRKHFVYNYNGSERADFICTFDKISHNVKYVHIENITSITTDGTAASCGELALLEDAPKINITSMTSSEFVGCIQDLNTKYDMIYIGGKGRTNQGNSSTDAADLINGNGPRLYAHIGEYKNPKDKKIIGMMDTDYTNGGVKDNTSDFSATLRGSGNDITRQQADELIEFAKSGYPLIISDVLYSQNGIDTTKVDNSSYIYDFLKELETLKNAYPNICRKSEADTGNKKFFANLPKPVIRFAEDGKPASAIKENVNAPDQYIGDELRFVFQIEDQAQTSMVNARYDCELYLDLNSDGNFSQKEKLDDIQIQDREGNILLKNENGDYELSMNRQYTVTRPIPETYIKLITWKLKVSNNSRQQIWTTEQGYCRRKAERREQIKVLQIMTNNSSGKYPNTWNLQNNQQFKNLLSGLNNPSQGKTFEFDIQVTSWKISKYVEEYKKGYENQHRNILEDYNMLIIGFADMYDNIPDTVPNVLIPDESGKLEKPSGSMTAILDFIEDEKSVLFSHDTTAFFSNRLDENLWGHGFNYILRPVLGLDRYGITDAEIGSILRRGSGHNLEKGSAEWERVYKKQHHFKDGKLLRSDGDMAYMPGTNKEETVWHTHGFTNSIIINNQDRVTTAKQVNQGAITQYPYVIPENLNVSETHGQYFQLALEEDDDNDGTNDIIVWYCLSGAIYDQSPNDVRNNYYLYSKGNVMYTGVGHSNVNQENEMKLFINAIVASYRASAVDPKVQFVNDFSRTAQKKQVEYYMTDQFIGSDEQNIVDNSKDIYFTVDDYNLVASDKFIDDSRSMKLELFIDAPDALDSKVVQGIADGRKVQQLSVPLYVKSEGDREVPQIFGEKGVYYTVASGNVYKFNINDLEEYVAQKDEKGNKIGYKDDVKIYAKVYSEFEMYGETKKGSGTSELSIRRRQLFDLD